MIEELLAACLGCIFLSDPKVVSAGCANTGSAVESSRLALRSIHVKVGDHACIKVQGRFGRGVIQRLMLLNEHMGILVLLNVAVVAG